MGRRAVPEEEMKRRVNVLISVLKEEDRNVYHDELKELTGLEGKLPSTIKYCRRLLEKGEISLRDYPIATSEGYFLPTRGKEVVAYALYWKKRLESEMKTYGYIVKLAQEKWPIEYAVALQALRDEDETDEDVIPYSVYESVYDAITKYKEDGGF